MKNVRDEVSCELFRKLFNKMWREVSGEARNEDWGDMSFIRRFVLSEFEGDYLKLEVHT